MSAAPVDAGTVQAVIVDDTPDLRMLLRLTLERDGDISVVGEAGDGREGIDVATRLQPDLVMLDLAMPVMDGLEALPRIRSACPDACIVVLSGFEAGAMKERSMRAGADAYVQKGTPPRELLGLVKSLLGRTGDGPASAARAAIAGPPVQPRSRQITTPDRRAPVTSWLADEAPVGLVVVLSAVTGGDEIGYSNVVARTLLGIPAAASGSSRPAEAGSPGLQGAPPGPSLRRTAPALAAVLGRHRRSDLSGAGTTDRLVVGSQSLEVSLRSVHGDVVITLARSRAHTEVERLRQAIRTTAHEIRNPVTLLSGVASVLSEAGESLTDEQKQHLLDAVARQASVLERVSEDLLTAAQAGRGALRLDRAPLQVVPLLRDVVHDVAGAQPVVLDAADDVWALADPDRVAQVLANLLSNALAYADGPYEVSARSTTDGWVRLAVSDHGPGVPELFQPRLFDEFSRAPGTREAGTGLGLYVVRSLAEAHGGRAEFEPRPGGGSTFSVLLPAAAPGPVVPAVPVGRGPQSRTGLPDSL